MARVALSTLAAALIGALSPQLARADSLPAFKTPGEAAYCQMQFVRNGFDAFLCFTPNDGWWIRFTGVMGQNVQVTKGYNNRYRGYRSSAYGQLAFGTTWSSSDAMLVSCRSRSNGLTCKHFGGLSFWIGRYKGYRIFVSPAGTRVAITRPFFRTSFGVYCGLGASLEPDAPSVVCWRPSDGLELMLPHQLGVRSGWSRNENNRNYRPRGYPLLAPGAAFRWTCASVDTQYATRCTRNGSTTPVFRCTTTVARLTCRNDRSLGFWVSRSSFYNF